MSVVSSDKQGRILEGGELPLRYDVTAETTTIIIKILIIIISFYVPKNNRISLHNNVNRILEVKLKQMANHRTSPLCLLFPNDLATQ